MRRAAEKARMVFFETMSWRYTPICTSPANPGWLGRSLRVRGRARLGGRRTEHAHHEGLHADGGRRKDTAGRRTAGLERQPAGRSLWHGGRAERDGGGGAGVRR